MTKRIECIGRAEIERRIVEQGRDQFLQSYNVVSLLDTGLSSPFMFSIYKTHEWLDKAQFGGHPNLITLHVDDFTPENAQTHADEFGNGDIWDFTPFDEDHAKRVIHWFWRIKRNQGNNLLPIVCHCWYGYSRSGAVGLWLARQLDVEEQFLEDNPQVRPNKYILELLDRYHSEEIAWASGLFDGEGTIGIIKSTHNRAQTKGYKGDKVYSSYGERISVGMTHLPTIQRLKDVLGFPGTITVEDRPNNRKPCYRVAAANNKAITIIKKMLPYLFTKSEQAYTALAFRRLVNSKPRGIMPEDYLEERERLYTKIRHLNAKGLVPKHLQESTCE